MKFNVGDFLRAATMAAHGTIAGHIQGEQERQAEQQQQFSRDRSLFEMGNQLEQQRSAQEEQFDQGVHSTLPLLNDPDRAAWTQTLLQRQAARAGRAGDLYNQFAGRVGLPGGSPPAGASGGAPPPPPMDAPAVNPHPGAAAALGVSPLPSVDTILQGRQPAQDQPAAAAPAAPAGPPAPSAAQMAMMHMALQATAPFVPGGQMMLNILNAHHPEVNAPSPQDAARMGNNMLQDMPGAGRLAADPSPAAPPAPLPIPTAPAAAASSPAEAPSISLPGFPAAHLDYVDPKEKSAALAEYKAAVADTKNLDPSLAATVAPYLDENGQVRTAADLDRLRGKTATIRRLLVGTGATQEHLIAGAEKSLETRATALPRDRGVAVGEILKLQQDFARHTQVYPNNNLRDYFSDPQMRQDIRDMAAARTAGDEDRAEEIAGVISGRLAKGMSPTEENKRLGFVYKDIGALSTAQANDPATVRGLYARAGLGYMVENLPDEQLRSGGWRAQKALEGNLKAISSPGFARLTAASQGPLLDATRELVHETGYDGKITLPASVALKADPLMTKRLSLMDKQIDLAGTRQEVAKAHLKIDQDRLQIDQQRLDLAQKKFAQIGKSQGASDKTWNREALMHRDMWTQAEKEKAAWLRGDKTTIADKKSWSADEQATYNQLNDRAANRKQEYMQFFQQHGITVGAADDGGKKPPARSAKPISEMSAAEAAAELAREFAKLPQRRK